jgi:hypothetical protein
MKDVDPRCIGITKEILTMTLEPAPSCRWQDIDLLINKLMQLQEMSGQKEFLSEALQHNEVSADRDPQGIQIIRKKLSSANYYIVSRNDERVQRGIVGEFVWENKKKYNAVLWLNFKDSVIDTIVSSLQFENGLLDENQSREALYGYKLRLLYGHGPDTLVVIDGYKGNAKEDPHLKDLIHGGDFHVIVIEDESS